MPTPFEPPDFVANFLNKVELNADEIPHPYGHDIISPTDPGLPVRVRGHLSQLAEKDLEITRVFAWQHGETVQKFISSKNTGYYSMLRELYRKEETDRSKSREKWFCGLAPKDQSMFDDHCLLVAGTVLHPLFPPDAPACLRGPLARLALEYSALVRRAAFRRNETEKSLASCGQQNHTIVKSVLNALVRVHEEAKSGLVGRWFRELTPEQETAFDGGNLGAKAGGADEAKVDDGKPAKYLKNWREILDCLELKNSAENRRFVTVSNQHYDGPITLPKRGGQPFVGVTKLLEWWNHLEAIRQTQGGDRNTEANVEAKFKHGKNETVVPEISGHVKNRRAKK
jgi:hypothetical protein